MKKTSRENALAMLKNLLGSSFSYGLKSPDTDLFDIGFGEKVNFINILGQTQETCKYAIHFTSAITLFWDIGCPSEFTSESDSKEFYKNVAALVGKRVEGIDLTPKNDIIIFLESCKMIITTHEDSLESWRFFRPGTGCEHLVSSCQSIFLQ